MILVTGANGHVGFNVVKMLLENGDNTIAAKPPFIKVRDVVRGHVLAAQKGASGRYILAADAPPTFPEVIKTMRQIDPKIPSAMMIVPKAMYGALPFFDWLSNKTLDSSRTMTSEFARSMKSGSMLANNSKAKREFGWKPSVSLEQSPRDTMGELRAMV